MRIIGGRYRSRLLHFPQRAELRPTPDRVRETLFNWLGQDLSGRTCLDLFAGSGALGFEAVSRNAARVVMVERDRRTLQQLQVNARLLGCEPAVELHCGDALQFARATPETFDVVFLDPPFTSSLITAIMPLVSRLTRPGGAVYVESAETFEMQPPWQLHRRSKAGHVTFQLFAHDDQ